MSYNTLSLVVENHIALLTVNRPQALNALNGEVVRELGECLKSLVQNKEVRCLIVTGSGEKAFVAGADIKEMQERDSQSGEQMALEGQGVLHLLETAPFPSIAAVNGFALGGGLELALACDFIVASKNAKLGLPEVSLGLIPGYGGTQRLSRYVGKGLARLMTVTGDLYSAEQCTTWGLVAILTEPADLLPTCRKLAQKITERSPHAVALARQAINNGYDFAQTDGLKLEAELFQKAFASNDKVEGVAAFIEKRKPQF
jgi:enoyl-CoA hydratase